MVKSFHPKLLTIGCWNINGIYEKVNNVQINKLEDEIFLNVLKRFDILCLQETHIGQDDKPIIPDDYAPVPHCRSISSNNQYFGGMLLLIRKSVKGLVSIRKDYDQDVIEVLLKKKAFNLREDKRIIFAYASPITSPYTNAREMNVLEKLETKDACCQNTLLMGDLNGRTGNVEDFVRDSEDKHCPVDTPLYTRDLSLQRNNLDPSPVDQQGKLILNLCKSTGLRILNGRTFGDRDGNLTRYPLQNVENVDDYPDISVNPKEETFIFDHDRLDIFKENIRNDERLESLKSLVDQNGTAVPIDFLEGVTQINNILISAAKKSFLPHKSRKGPPKSAERGKKKVWYNKECASYKALLRKYSRMLSSNPFHRNTLNLFQNCKHKYKKVCRTAEKQFCLKMNLYCLLVKFFSIHYFKVFLDNSILNMVIKFLPL